MVDKIQEQRNGDMQQRVLDTMADNLKATADSFYDALVVKPMNEVAVLPERIFVALFLPYFCGEETIDASESIFEKWISIAGAPVAEVAIIDDARNVLFRVPSLFDSSVIDVIKKNPRVALHEIYLQSELRRSNIPALGDRYSADALADRTNTLVKQPDHLDEKKARWNEIFKRYGKVSVGVESAFSKSADQDIDVEYD